MEKMARSQKILLVWGMVMLSIFLILSAVLASRAETAPPQEKAAHSHGLCLTYLVLFMALLVPYFKMPEELKQYLGMVLGIGSVIMPLGVWIGMPVLNAIGAILVILPIIGFTIVAIIKAAER